MAFSLQRGAALRVSYGSCADRASSCSLLPVQLFAKSGTRSVKVCSPGARFDVFCRSSIAGGKFSFVLDVFGTKSEGGLRVVGLRRQQPVAATAESSGEMQSAVPRRLRKGKKRRDEVEDDDEDSEEMSDKALNALFKQLAKDLGEEDIDMDAELTEEEMLVFERELNAALVAAGGKRALDADSDSDLEAEDEEEVEGEKDDPSAIAAGLSGDEDEEDFFSLFEESEDELEDVDVSLDDFDEAELRRARDVLAALQGQMLEVVKEGANAAKNGPLSELRWTAKKLKAVENAASYVKFFLQDEEEADEEHEESESAGPFEIDEGVIQIALKVLEQVEIVYDGREKQKQGTGDDLLRALGVDLKDLEASRSVLEQIMEAGDEEDESDAEGENFEDVIDVKVEAGGKEEQLGSQVESELELSILENEGKTEVLSDLEEENEDFEVEDYNVEDIAVAALVFDKLFLKMKERKKQGGEALMIVGKELEWTRKTENIVKRMSGLLHHLEEMNAAAEEGKVEEGGEVEVEGEEMQLALEVVDGILEFCEEDGERGLGLLKLLELEQNDLETTAAFLREIMDEDDELNGEEEDEEEVEEEDEEDVVAEDVDEEDEEAIVLEMGEQERSGSEASEGVSGRGQDGLKVTELSSRDGEGGRKGNEWKGVKEVVEAASTLAVGAAALATSSAAAATSLSAKSERSFAAEGMTLSSATAGPSTEMARQQSEREEGKINASAPAEQVEEEDDTRRRVHLARWQLRKLAKAVKLGRRNVNIRALVGESKLDRRDVLAFLANPPPGLEDLDLGLEEDETGEAIKQGARLDSDDSGRKTKNAELEEEEDSSLDQVAKSGPWNPNLQREWHGRKRLRKEHIATFEKIYESSRYPTGAMVQNLVELTHVPRRRILEWFSEKREQDRPKSLTQGFAAIDPVRPGWKRE